MEITQTKDGYYRYVNHELRLASAGWAAEADLISSRPTLRFDEVTIQLMRRRYEENFPPKALTPEEIAFRIGELINSTSARPFLVGEEIALREHRFLQQEFWTLVEGFVKQSARNFSNSRYDDRNAYTVKMCRRIEDMLDKWRQEIANERI